MRLPIVDNEYAFRLLAKRFGAGLVCDVGAFDGAHSKRFRAIGARVIAFEPNPACYEALSVDKEIAAAGIEIVAKAAWNENGNVGFHVVSLPIGGALSERTPISSVLERMPAYGFASERKNVEAVRLDTYVTGLGPTDSGPIAIWIDAEGAGYEVIEGMEHIRRSVCLVQVEVETARYWLNQRLDSDVVELMRRFGFTPIARSLGNLQYDLLFVNNEWLERARPWVRWSIAVARFRLRAREILQLARRARDRLLLSRFEHAP